MRLLAVLLMCSLALAGCSDDSPSEASKLNPDPAPTPGSATSTGTTSSGGSGSSGSSGGSGSSTQAANTPPHATLEASPVSGVSPLTVSFTIDGSDPDGDSLTWSLDLDGDGTPESEGAELPASYEHTFEEGDHTAQLEVSDGNETTTATIQIEVAAPSAPEPTGPTQVVDGTYTVPLEGCTIAFPSHVAEQDLGTLVGSDLDGVTRVQFAVDEATYGLPFTVTWTFDVGYLYAGLAFTDAEGAILGDVTTDPSAMEAGLEEVTKEGTVPDGAVTGVAWTCGGPAEASVHYEA